TEMSTKRHGGNVHYKVGVMKDGKLRALQTKFELDTGAYASAGDAVAYRGALFCSGPYEVPHVDADSKAVYTNTAPGGAMRGFGSTQPALISEIMIDEVARELDMDPFEIRRLNGLEEGKQTIAGHVIDSSSSGFMPTLKAVKEALDREEIPESKEGKRIGIGIASSMKNVGLGAGMEDGAGAEIELQEKGSFLLKIGSVDCGQGSDTTMAQIAARTLNVPYNLIDIKANDTAVTPDGGVTTASRQTFVTGNAVRVASIKFRELLLKFVEQEIDIPASYLELVGDSVLDIREDKDFEISLTEIAARAKKGNKDLMEQHYYVAPETKPFKDHTDNPEYNTEEYRMHFAYCYGTQAAIVEVDEESGEVEVLKVIAAHDTGKTVNPSGVEGQIEGGILMGLGYALSEEYKTEKGRMITDNFRKLGIPTIDKTPEMESILIEDHHPNGPYGAKGMSELPLNPTAPAIANAIYDATGVRVNKFPVNKAELSKLIKQSKN
ncbi:MAG: xanthine dehydrogenase family protein molybdopterin-binding subunit, partial [Halanaerobiales bacterium]